MTVTAEEKRTLRALLIYHDRHHPGFGVADLHKLLYQAAFGLEHLLEDPHAFRRSLEREWAEAGPPMPMPAEPLIEPIDPKWERFRINLRPYKHTWKGDLDRLVHVLLNSPPTKGDPDAFWSYWGLARQLVEEGLISFNREALDAWEQAMAGRGRGLRPVHHSAAYARRNRPSYRLIGQGGLEALGLSSWLDAVRRELAALTDPA